MLWGDVSYRHRLTLTMLSALRKYSPGLVKELCCEEAERKPSSPLAVPTILRMFKSSEMSKDNLSAAD